MPGAGVVHHIIRVDCVESVLGPLTSRLVADLLQRSGMQLGGVSVGGQAMSSDAEQPRQRREERTGVAKVGSTAGGGSDTLTTGSRRPNVDGSRRLDVFA